MSDEDEDDPQDDDHGQPVAGDSTGPVLREEATPTRGLYHPPVRPRDPPHPDSARWWVTAWLLGLVSVIVLGAGVAVAFGKLDAETALQLVFPPVLSAVATAIGFYFGSHRSSGGQDHPH